MKTTKIIKKIEQISIKDIENDKKIRKYVEKALTTGGYVTLFNWECPPRQIKNDFEGQPYVDFDIDMAKISKNQKLDEYTEIPRVIEEKENEISIISYMKQLSIPLRFVKLIADTNIEFIYPKTLEIMSKDSIQKSKDKFKKLIENQVKDYPIKVEVYNVWDLIKDQNLEKEYIKIYNELCNLLKTRSQSVISKRFFEEQIERTNDHIGIKNKKWALETSIRIIATYGAEGIILGKLNALKQGIWMNIEEVDSRSIAITNTERKRRGLDRFPMVFPNAKLINRKEINK